MTKPFSKSMVFLVLYDIYIYLWCKYIFIIIKKIYFSTSYSIVNTIDRSDFSQITNAHHCNSSHLAGVLPAMSILITQYFLNFGIAPLKLPLSSAYAGCKSKTRRNLKK